MLSHSQKDPGSEIRKNKFIPDPGGKKAPDPRSATLYRYCMNNNPHHAADNKDPDSSISPP
jgi:hypothetical protein